MKKLKMKKGMTLIELIISLALLVIIIVPISSFALGSLKNSLKAEQKQRARYHGKVFLDQMKYYDEIILKTENGQDYFKLLDHEIMIKDGVLNKYTSKVEKDNFKIEMGVNEDINFDYNKINNLENIKGENLILYLNESNLDLKLIKNKEQVEDIEKKDFDVDSFTDNLTIGFEENSIKVEEKNLGVLINKNINIVDKGLIIYVDKDFELEKTIEIENNTNKLIRIYVIKDNGIKTNKNKPYGKANVIVKEGSLLINDEINLFEDNIEGKRYNFSIKVEDKNNNLLFEGNSSRNLVIKKRGE